ncbi:MAG: hypothetical protein H6651_11985 [Ardenticatenales bacterium]|nr:hypothetical protein [Ardenticatenales bacterium]
MVWRFLGYLTLFPLLSGEGLYWDVGHHSRAVFPVAGPGDRLRAALGLGYYFLMRLLALVRLVPRADEGRNRPVPRACDLLPARLRSILIGGIGGLLGGWVFLLGIDRSFFFPRRRRPAPL